jgi:hypothetical protein
MSFQIPKELTDFAGLGFEEVLPIDFNDIDLDRMWPHLLELLVRFGRIVKSKTDPMAYDTYASALSSNSAIVGLTSERRREVLDGWTRASLVHIGRKGLRRDEFQIDHLRPVTAAVYRSGLPKQRSRNRRADVLVYSSSLNELSRRGIDHGSNRALRDATIRALGVGIDFGQVAEDAPRYDGQSPVDVTALLSLLFMEGIPEPAGLGKRLDYPKRTLPGAMDPIGTDLLDCLGAYGGALPAVEITQYLLGLIALRLFQLPLRYARAFRALLENGELIDDYSGDAGRNPLELYCDFTRVRGSESEELAKASVQRDLEIMRQFFADRLFLRTLIRLDEFLPDLTQELRALRDRPMEKLQFLLQRRGSNDVSKAVKFRLSKLRTLLEEGPEHKDGVKLLEAMQNAGATDDEQLTQLLVEGLRKRGLENQVKWFWSTGGISKPYGLLRGTLKARRTWRYEPSDPLLLAMLLVCFVDDNGTRTRSEMPVAELIERLRARFGVLIDRPPGGLNGPNTRAAASANRAAFLRQLQLLGCFDGLSDDFAAQIVRRPREAAV